MTDTSVPDAAVQIVADVMVQRGVYHGTAEHAVAALAREGWLHDPAEVAALRAVAEAVAEVRASARQERGVVTVSRILLGSMGRALDALPPAAPPPS